MDYTLRLFENDAEVRTLSVGYVSGAQNYPLVGQRIDDVWLVVDVISHTETERCLRVERIEKGSNIPGWK